MRIFVSEVVGTPTSPMVGWPTKAAALVMLGLAWTWDLPSVAATPDQFKARTTADLVGLCSAEPSDENYVAAIHFCHGFATGAYQYYLSLAAASEANRFVCPPEPPPSRTEAIAGFVTWARQNALAMAEPPVESMFRYLAEHYPCNE